MDRKAAAQWKGDLKSGIGSLSVGSGAFSGAYSFISRFESNSDTNPEELIGAAHAGCFSMALAHTLSSTGHVVTSIKTDATVQINKTDAGFTITGIILRTRGAVSGISNDEFVAVAEKTKVTCIVSRALAAVPISLDAALDG